MHYLQFVFLSAFTLLVLDMLSAQNVKAFYVGHSLSDQVPDMTKSLSDDDPSVSMNWVYQSIPGAPLRWQWQRKEANDYTGNPPYSAAFYDTIYGLPVGDFDALILTESVPRDISPWGIVETYEYADSFYTYFQNFNPGKQVYLYEVWHCLNSGTPTGCSYDTDSNPWRQRLSDDLPMWESVIDTINCRFQPEIPLRLIPGGQGLARLHDSIQAGVIPGISDISHLFSDDIHLTDVGKYFIACIHFSVIHGKSPEGLTHQTQVWWGGNFTPPTPAQALKFQQIAWQTVTDLYYLTGVYADGLQDDSYVWKGTRSSSWSNPCNWDRSQTPQPMTEVIVMGNRPHPLEIDENINLHSLQLLPNASVVITSGVEVHIE